MCVWGGDITSLPADVFGSTPTCYLTPQPKSGFISSEHFAHFGKLRRAVICNRQVRTLKQTPDNVSTRTHRYEVMATGKQHRPGLDFAGFLTEKLRFELNHKGQT